MNLTLFLPGAVVLLKALLKISIGKTVTLFAFVKALIFFPVDVVFLALSYIVARMVMEPTISDPVRVTALVMIIGFVLAILVNLVCNASDQCLDSRKGVQAALLAFLGLTISAVTMLFAVNIVW